MALSDSKSQDSTDTCAICFQKKNKNQLFMKKAEKPTLGTY